MKVTNRELHLLFVDVTKVYDSVPLNKLFEILDKASINVSSIKAIKSLYEGAISKTKVGKKSQMVLK